jgi:phosphoribosyl-ATP pyrophosphohydrolase/phosphoribosyl-AMP cyclohydrolase
VKDILIDCDQDTILIKADPQGPTCHTGSDTCFDEEIKPNNDFLYQLEGIIADRKNNPTEESYTVSLFRKGVNKIAQKVGEEATEVVIEAIDNNRERLKEETADLLYHLLVLLAEKDISLSEISEVLRNRHLK